MEKKKKEVDLEEAKRNREERKKREEEEEVGNCKIINQKVTTGRPINSDIL